jgi:hypothetical protein
MSHLRPIVSEFDEQIAPKQVGGAEMIDISRRHGQARLGSIMAAMFAAGSAAFVVGILPSGSAQAVEECVEAPNSAPPQGSHWYYRTDRANQRKCWYLGPQGKKLQESASQEQQPPKERAQRPPETTDLTTRVQPEEPTAEVERAIPAGDPTPAAAVRWLDSLYSLEAFARSGTASAPALQEHAGMRGQEIDASDEMPAHASSNAETTTADAPPVAPLTVLFQVLALAAGALAVIGIFLRTVLKMALRRRGTVILDRSIRRDEPSLPDLDHSFPPRQAASEGTNRFEGLEEMLRMLRERERRAA